MALRCKWYHVRFHVRFHAHVLLRYRTAFSIFPKGVWDETTLWCGWSFVKLTFYLHHTPILALASRHNGTNNSSAPSYYGHASSPRIPRLYHIQGIDRIKWRMITTFNRKLLEKQRVLDRFASYEVHIGHFFYNVNATVSFGNRLTLSIFRFQNFSLDRQTD